VARRRRRPADPQMATWIDRRRELMLSGTRRFYEDARLAG
jgi:hypothetical protein